VAKKSPPSGVIGMDGAADGNPAASTPRPVQTCPRCSDDATIVACTRSTDGKWLECPRKCGFRVQDLSPMVAQLQAARLRANRVESQDRSARPA
jgi:hypothetical protein